MLGKLAHAPGRKGRSFRPGVGAGEALLYGFIGVLVLLAAYAIVQSFSVQNRVASTFDTWYEDTSGYQRAMQEQAQTGKPVLVYFYATWCPHCKNFTARVLSDGRMRDFVQQYPHVRIAPDNGQAEKDLMSEFGAEGYPAFYVVTADGQRHKIETYAETPEPHPRSAQEFIAAIRQVTGE